MLVYNAAFLIIILLYDFTHEWKSKAMHSERLSTFFKNKIVCWAALSCTEGFMCVAVATLANKRLITKERVENEQRRMCDSALKTLGNLISGCTGQT